jgi:hypothetical protein
LQESDCPTKIDVEPWQGLSRLRISQSEPQNDLNRHVNFCIQGKEYTWNEGTGPYGVPT